MLTDAQVTEYHERGYVVPDYRLPEAELEDIRARMPGCSSGIPSSATMPRCC